MGLNDKFSLHQRKTVNNIVLLRDVFHIGLDIGPKPTVLAWGAAERQIQQTEKFVYKYYYYYYYYRGRGGRDSYSSWIYNYLYNQWLSSLEL
jgi:hypothetical protein